MSFTAKAARMGKPANDDKLLVQECLRGNEDAWSDLIDKYKNLIFSVPIRYGFTYEDATEIFQTVSMTLLRDLSQLREPQALAAWLIRMTARTCVRFRNERRVNSGSPINEEDYVETEKHPEGLLYELEREQILRVAVAELPTDCKHLVDLLFFSDPPMRYVEAAKELGLSTGSMGATRMRCLDKLRGLLEKKGFG